MNLKIKLLAVALIAMTASTAVAQGHFSVHLGGNFPMGDYANVKANYDKNTPSNSYLTWALENGQRNRKAGAGIGFNVGAKYTFDISSVKGLGIVAGADFMYNGVSTEIRDYFSDYIDDLEDEYRNRDFSYTFPSFINIPVTVGVNYYFPLNSNLSLFVEGAMGLNVRIITKDVWSESEDNFEYTREWTFNPAYTFAYRFGAGLLINGHYSIDLNYYGAGAAKVTGEYNWEQLSGGTTTSDGDKIKGGTIAPSQFCVRLGYRF